jgi:hypothetical protein
MCLGACGIKFAFLKEFKCPFRKISHSFPFFFPIMTTSKKSSIIFPSTLIFGKTVRRNLLLPKITV